jgi:hypothetical protein
MEYSKFNNSRSNKHPFFIYLPDVRGSKWGLVDRADLIPVSEETYKAVKASYDNGVPEPGDKVVIIEFVPLKQRYGVAKEITEGEHPSILLEDGRRYLLRDVRKESFIHMS